MPDTPKDDVAFSFLMAGDSDSQPNIDLDKTPTEEELKAMEEEEHRKAEEEYRSNRSFGSLGALDKSTPDPDDKPDDDKPDDDKPDDDKPDDKPDDDPDDKPDDEDKKPKKKVSFKETPVDPIVPSPRETPQPKPEPKEQPKEEPTKEEGPLSAEELAYMDTLPDDAKDSVEFFLGAEGVDEKYKGYAKRQLDYLRQHQEKIDQLEEADPDTPIEENPRYIAWVNKNKPKVSQREIRRIDREIVINEAEKRASSKSKKELEELRNWRDRKEFEEKNLPKLQQESMGYSKKLVAEIGEVEGAEEVVNFYNKALEEHGDPTKATELMKEEYPDEAEILMNHHRSGMTMANEFLQLRMGFVAPDPSGNPLHRELSTRILAQESAMEQPNMKEQRQRDGKMFASVEQMRNMSPEERDRHWTFSDQEILTFLTAEVRHRTQKDLANHKKKVAGYIERYGKKSTSVQESPKLTPKEAADDTPRHEGVDAPGSGVRESGGEGRRKSKLIDFDY